MNSQPGALDWRASHHWNGGRHKVCTEQATATPATSWELSA